MNPTKRETLFAHLHKPLGAFVYLDPRRAGLRYAVRRTACVGGNVNLIAEQ